MVPIHLRLHHAILTVDSMEVGTYHFTHGPKSQVPSMTQSTWQHVLEAGLGSGLVLRVGLSKNLDRTLNTSPMNSVAWNIHSNVFLRLKSWDFACMHRGDLLTWVGLGTLGPHCEPTLSHNPEHITQGSPRVSQEHPIPKECHAHKSVAPFMARIHSS